MKVWQSTTDTNEAVAASLANFSQRRALLLNVKLIRFCQFSITYQMMDSREQISYGLQLLNQTDDPDYYVNISAHNGTNGSASVVDDKTCQSTAFFDNYYSKFRFGFETFLCVAAVTMNILTIIFIKATRQEASPSRILFLNLAVTNMMSSALFWLCNNVLYLFRRQLFPLMAAMSTRCTVSLLLMAAAFLSSLFIVISTFTLLGFAVVQFIAICRPLQSLLVITLPKIRIYLLVIWTLAGVASYLPFVVLLAKTSWVPCTARFQDEIQRVTVLAANVSAFCTVAVFSVLIGVCVRVYAEIRMLRKRLEKYRQLQDTVSDRKAFTTTLIFILTLTLFYVPYE